MKNPILSLLILLSCTLCCSAQIKFQEVMGGSADEYSYFIEQTNDSGFIVTGTTASFGLGNDDIYLIKVRANGTVDWTRTYGGSDIDRGYCVHQTSDHGYIISGNTIHAGSGNKDACLIKTDSAGDPVWTSRYGGTGADYGNSVQQTNDGGYMLCGTTESFGAGSYDVYLIRTNSDGDTLWTKTFGGSGYEDANSIQHTNDGGYIMTGTTASFGAGGYDVYVIKTNANGDTLWIRTYGGPGDDYGFSIQQTNDSGYILTGTTSSFGAGSYDAYLIRTDANGEPQWTKTFGGTGWDAGDFVQQTNDGGYIVSGQTMSFGVASDAYLIKTDANGDTLWTKIFGGSGYDYGSGVRQTIDGGYMISASAKSFGSGPSDFYLIKTDANGNSGCHEGNPTTLTGSHAITVSAPPTIISVTATLPLAPIWVVVLGGGILTTQCTNVGINEPTSEHSFHLFPNPSNGNFTITSGTGKLSSIMIYDLLGVPVNAGIEKNISSASSIEVNLKNVSPGIYFVRVWQDNVQFTEKLIVQ